MLPVLCGVVLVALIAGAFLASGCCRPDVGGSRSGSDALGARCSAGRRLEPRLRRCGRDKRSAAAEDVALDGLRPSWRPRALSRHRRVHREEPRLAGSERPAQACRGGLGRRIGRGRRRVVQTLSADQRHGQGPRGRDHLELRRSRRRHRGLAGAWIAADFGPLDEKNFLARHSASLRPEDHAKRVDRLLWDGQSEAAHRMLGTGAARLSRGGRGSLGACRAGLKCRGIGRPGSCTTALRSRTDLRAAAMAPQKGHDRRGRPDPARPAQRPRPAGGVVG